VTHFLEPRGIPGKERHEGDGERRSVVQRPRQHGGRDVPGRKALCEARRSTNLEIHPPGPLRKADEIERALESVLGVRSGVRYRGGSRQPPATGGAKDHEPGESETIYK